MSETKQGWIDWIQRETGYEDKDVENIYGAYPKEKEQDVDILWKVVDSLSLNALLTKVDFLRQIENLIKTFEAHNNKIVHCDIKIESDFFITKYTWDGMEIKEIKE